MAMLGMLTYNDVGDSTRCNIVVLSLDTRVKVAERVVVVGCPTRLSLHNDTVFHKENTQSHILYDCRIYSAMFFNDLSTTNFFQSGAEIQIRCNPMMCVQALQWDDLSDVDV